MPLFGPSAFTSAREKKLSQRQAALDKASEALSGVPVHPQEELICTTSARDLSRKITSKEWSSLTVVAAFARRLLAAQAELNCLTEGITLIDVSNGSNDCRCTETSEIP